jgi:RHS repeat-associated protein
VQLSYYGGLVGDAPPAAGVAFTWNQEYNDPVSGLVYLRSRWYHPRLACFMSADPLFVDNRYNYGSGSPVNFADPTGESAVAILSFVIGVVVGMAVTDATAGVATAAAAARHRDRGRFWHRLCRCRPFAGTGHRD